MAVLNIDMDQETCRPVDDGESVRALTLSHLDRAKRHSRFDINDPANQPNQYIRIKSALTASRSQVWLCQALPSTLVNGAER
jgi:hypothetical protein